MVQLRPFGRDELAVLQRFATEPEAVGEFNWAGFRDANQVIERFEQNGLLTPDRSELAVVDQDQVVGAVQWVTGEYAGSRPATAGGSAARCCLSTACVVSAPRLIVTWSSTCSPRPRPCGSRPTPMWPTAPSVPV